MCPTGFVVVFKKQHMHLKWMGFSAEMKYSAAVEQQTAVSGNCLYTYKSNSIDATRLQMSVICVIEFKITELNKCEWLKTFWFIVPSVIQQYFPGSCVENYDLDPEEMYLYRVVTYIRLVVTTLHWALLVNIFCKINNYRSLVFCTENAVE